jgi:hypothetical protein
MRCYNAAMKRPFQFSMRRMFRVYTALIVLIGTEIAIVHGCNNQLEKNEENRLRLNIETEENRLRLNHEAALKAYRANRTLLESNRANLSPQDYKRLRKQTDQDWKQLDPGPVPDFP